MNGKVSHKKDEEDLKNRFIVDSYEKMLALLDKGYEVEEELIGDLFLMRKK